MAYEYSFDCLKKKYNDFKNPEAHVIITNLDIEKSIVVSDIEIDLTSTMEASTALFKLYNVFDDNTGQFQIDSIKNYIYLGSAVSISMGYGGDVRLVFSGFISRVNFLYEDGGKPCVEITALDVKGIMMSSSYSRQLKAKTYSEAVKEIFKNVILEKLKSIGVMDNQLEIQETPDTIAAKKSNQKDKETDETMEMVSESDYDFLEKATKKFGFECYMIGKKLYFVKTMSNRTKLMQIGIGIGMLSFEIGYEHTGVVEAVEVRGMDAGTGKIISAKKKYEGELSMGKKAKPLIKNTQYTCLDASVRSQTQAEQRADVLMQEISLRLGTLKAECVGIPELIPGRFLKINGLGEPAENQFYITRVRHILDENSGFRSLLYGKVSSIKSEEVNA